MMKIYYDFHIHSALSPCASDEMTPQNIVAVASIKDIQAIAVCDHNAIDNVLATMQCGQEFGVTVIPGIEVQTSEDIHVLALFDTFPKLQEFYNTLHFPSLQNNVEIFGNQLIIDSDNQIVGQNNQMLLIGALESIYQITKTIMDMGGKAILAHIDRDANGILQTLGVIPDDLEFSAIEFSENAEQQLKSRYEHFKCITNSDAHYLTDIGTNNYLQAESSSIEHIFDCL